MEQTKRVTFYIDGFNFYFGLKRTKRIDPTWKRFYRIDMVKLCESFLGTGQVLEKVIYFTASLSALRRIAVKALSSMPTN